MHQPAFQEGGLGLLGFVVEHVICMVCFVCVCLYFNSLCCFLGVLMFGLRVCWCCRLDGGIVFSPKLVGFNEA